MTISSIAQSDTFCSKYRGSIVNAFCNFEVKRRTKARKAHIVSIMYFTSICVYFNSVFVMNKIVEFTYGFDGIFFALLF